MVLIQDKSPANLDALAEALFIALNPQNMDLSYHASSSIIGRIQAQMEDDLNAGNFELAAFWDYLLNNDYEKLHDIIIGRPGRLKELTIEIDDLFGDSFLSNKSNYDNATLTLNGGVVSAIFNYNTLYRRKQICPNNCRQFELDYCPYCNTISIEVININADLAGNELLMALFQLDHFYPQVRFPYLALSFFNLIPGCYPCNAQLKGDKAFDIDTHINPFHKRLDDYFDFKVDMDELIENNAVQIGYTTKAAHPVNSLDDFRIIRRYNQFHTKDVYRLYTTVKHHSVRVRRSILLQLAELLPPVAASRRRLLMANGVPINRFEINEYQLGKLKRDFCIQLEVL